MKKIITALFVLGFFINIFSVTLNVSADETLSITVNNEYIKTKYTTISNQFLFEYTSFLKQIEAKYTYTPRTKTLVITRGNTKITLIAGSKTSIVNGKKIGLKVAPTIIGSELYIPAQFICDSFSLKYTYDTKLSRINVIIPEKLLTLKEIVKLNNTIVLIKIYNAKHELLATGSGFIISADGKVVTNYHVIDKAYYCEVVTSDNSIYLANKVVNYDINRDIAILKVDNVKNLPYIKLGDSSSVQVGDDVVAIGSPLALQNTVSTGIISGKRKLDNYDYIQTTAPISPGSSGGALINMYGKAIGITTSSSVQGQSLNFVIPINDLKTYTQQSFNMTLNDVYINEHTIKYADGSRFEGDIKNGLPNGFGTYSTNDGLVYYGEFKDGILNGVGVLTSVKGGTYEGNFKDGMFEGKGTLITDQGDKYVGEFKAGKYEGEGRLISTYGYTYVGEYKNGLMHGKGLQTFNTGKVYEGDFRNEIYEGKGTLTLENGDKYVGEFKVGKYEGEGRFVSSSGYTYIGEYKNGVPEGMGTQTWPDGDKYTGDFKNGVRDGEGQYTWANGNRYEGEFKNGTRDGEGTLTWINGEHYKGTFKNGEIDGKGTYSFTSGNRYEGTFKDSKFNGIGTYYFTNGDRYEGMFKDGLQDGTGTYYFANGTKKSGMWSKGQFVDNNSVITVNPITINSTNTNFVSPDYAGYQAEMNALNYVYNINISSLEQKASDDLKAIDYNYMSRGLYDSGLRIAARQERIDQLVRDKAIVTAKYNEDVQNLRIRYNIQ